MSPKRSRKRKNTPQTSSTNGATTTDDAPLAPPDRSTWPGWVEMESEPAFFNIMLKEMDVRGVKIQEVYGLDDDMLSILPQPIHALIFLFRYKDTDQAEQEKSTECPQHIWFANQIPDFACASVALLNIVNNIKGLQMGKELRDFRDFTQDMDPLSRGDAIDSFEFVKGIHNSFARETDLLNADMHMKQKAAKAKKKQALAKARERREAKKTEKTPLKEKSANGTTIPTRKSSRSTQKVTEETKTPKLPAPSGSSSPLSDPPGSDTDFQATNKTATSTEKSNGPQRRSERTPKPRKDTFAGSAAVEAQDEEGFHFIAYMPIQGHVWKLDGLDSFPQDMGTFDATTGGDWMNIARPAVQTRMLLYEGADIEFNLMAVVHDPILRDRVDLAQNVNEIQAIEKKLDALDGDWRELDSAVTTKEVITSSSPDLDISQDDIGDATLPQDTVNKIEQEGDLLKLIELWNEIVSQQGPLRGAIRDALESSKSDDEKARHRRHDYGKFVRSWLGALADEEVLSELLDGA